MFNLLKGGCIAVYVLAVAGLAGLLPAGLGGNMQTLALILLAVHVLEAVVMFKHVRLYNGSLATSLLLTLLFGLLHWKPLADAQAKRDAGH